MTSSAVVAVIAAVVVALAGSCLVLLWRVLNQQKMLADEIGAVDEALRQIELRLEGLRTAAPDEAEPAARAVESDAEGEGMRGESIDAEIAPEIQAAITAAAIAAAGDKARVHAMRQVKTQEDGSAWSKQGRVLVQTSHNVRPSR